jgi:hypothetical protein
VDSGGEGDNKNEGATDLANSVASQVTTPTGLPTSTDWKYRMNVSSSTPGSIDDSCPVTNGANILRGAKRLFGGLCGDSDHRHRSLALTTATSTRLRRVFADFTPLRGLRSHDLITTRNFAYREVSEVRLRHPSKSAKSVFEDFANDFETSTINSGL